MDEEENGAAEVADAEKGDEVSIRISSMTVVFSSGTLGAIFVSVVDVVVLDFGGYVSTPMSRSRKKWRWVAHVNYEKAVLRLLLRTR